MKIENRLGTYLMLVLIAAFMFFALPIEAQTTTPPAVTTPPAATSPAPAVIIQPFAGFVRLTAGADASFFGLRAGITQKVNLTYVEYNVPAANGQFHLFEPEYASTADKAVPFLKGKTLFDLSKVQMWARGGLGVRRADAVGVKPALAYGVEAGAEVPIGTVGGGVVSIGFSGGIIGSFNSTFGGPQHFNFSNSGQIAPKLGITFGK